MKIMVGQRKSNCLARFGVFLTTTVLVVGMAGCCGYTSPSQNLEIRTWYDLDAVRDNLAGNHTLMNDLDSATAGYGQLASPTANGGKGWQPIGFPTPHGATAYEGFSGTIDGQGHEIHDLYINRPDEDRVGLFGETDGAVIRDVGVVNVAVIGDECAGALVGTTSGGIVNNCHSSGSVSGNDGVGGLVAANWGTVSNSYSSCNITGISGVGGLVGVNGPDKTISNCYSRGNVTGIGGVGALVGFPYVFAYSGTVTNSFWDTETSGQTASDGGAGRTTGQMKSIATFSGAGWNITAVADINMRDTTYVWNIVDGVTYPFLSWEPVS